MSTEARHIMNYRVYGWVLTGLLALTFLTITVTWINLSALTVFIALIIAAAKSTIVLTYFMHLKYESRLFRVFLIMVISIYVMVISLTFADYLFR